MKILPDKLYDVLKWISVICIPAVVVFLSVVLPALKVDAETVNTVTTIISAVGALIGSLICVSTYGYNKTKNDRQNSQAS